MATEEIPTKSGRVVILKLSEEGGTVIGKPASKPEEQKRHGGTAHEYWKNKYAEIYRRKGFTVSIEEPIGGGKTVDLVVRNEKQKIALEIETGRSDTLANIEKCLDADFDQVIIIATSEKAETGIKQLMQQLPFRATTKLRVECARRSDFKPH